jgi:hypothetical protein
MIIYYIIGARRSEKLVNERAFSLQMEYIGMLSKSSRLEALTQALWGKIDKVRAS